MLIPLVKPTAAGSSIPSKLSQSPYCSPINIRPSDALTAELRAMERLRGQDYEAFMARAKGLEPDKVDELKRLGAALTARFGDKALRPGADVARAAGLVQEVGRERLARLHELLVTATDATKVVEGSRSMAEEGLAARVAREAMLRAETPEARAERQVREAEAARLGEAKAKADDKGPNLGASDRLGP